MVMAWLLDGVLVIVVGGGPISPASRGWTDPIVKVWDIRSNFPERCGDDVRRKTLAEVCRTRSVDVEWPMDILIVVLGSSRPSSGAEGQVVITEHLLPAGHSR